MKSKGRGGRGWNLSGLEQLKEPLFSPSPELPDPAAELGSTQKQRGEAKRMSKEGAGAKHVTTQTASPLWGPIGPAGGGDGCWGPLSHHLKLTGLAQGLRVEARLWTWPGSPQEGAGGARGVGEASPVRPGSEGWTSM